MTQTWRDRVQQVAQERAQAEARQKWNVDSRDEIPFDYRWEHVQAVVGVALHLAEELDADREVIEAAAWLHDVCKLDEPHEINGAREAERLLRETDFPPDKIAAVVHAIRVHRGLTRDEPETPLEPLEAAILWDADKLTKLGVQTIVYSMSAPYASGKSLAERRRDFTEFARTILRCTVRSMNTQPARHMAERRYEEMMAALAAWEREEKEQGVMSNE